MKLCISAVAILVILFLKEAYATSIVISLSDKIEACNEIALVSITRLVPPRKNFFETEVVVTAQVTEQFKGKESHSDIQFRFNSVNDSSKKLKTIIGKQFIVFLHRPPGRESLFLFQGEQGMLPVQSEFSDWIINSNGDLIEKRYTKDGYFKILRAIQ